MTETITHKTSLARWAGDRGTYYHVVIDGDAADAITMAERLRRLEFGARRGFGSVKVMAQIGGTRWKTSVFPSKPKRSSSEALAQEEREWWLLVSKKVIRAEDLALDERLTVELELL